LPYNDEKLYYIFSTEIFTNNYFAKSFVKVLFRFSDVNFMLKLS